MAEVPISTKDEIESEGESGCADNREGAGSYSKE